MKEGERSAAPRTLGGAGPLRWAYAVLVVPVLAYLLVLAAIDCYALAAMQDATTAVASIASGALFFSLVRKGWKQGRPALRLMAGMIVLPSVVFGVVWAAAWIGLAGLVYFTSQERQELVTVVTDVARIRSRDCVDIYDTGLERALTLCRNLRFDEAPRTFDRVRVHSKVGPLGRRILWVEPETAGAAKKR